MTAASPTLSIPDDVLAILACPVDKAELRLEPDRLVCTLCGRAYPIVDGIPHLIAEEEPEVDGR